MILTNLTLVDWAVMHPWMASLLAVFFALLLVVSLNGLLTAIVTLRNRSLRHKNIRAHGWPPPHCDADGDAKTVGPRALYSADDIVVSWTNESGAGYDKPQVKVTLGDDTIAIVEAAIKHKPGADSGMYPCIEFHEVKTLTGLALEK